MSIARWSPFAEIADLRRTMDRFFNEPLVSPWHHHHYLIEAYTPVDMYQTDDALVVKASLPGVRPEDVELTITGDCLRIKGEAKVEREMKREDYFAQEVRNGSFSRTLSLPIPVKTDKAEATFERGLLTITIPKAEELKPKTIKVKALEEAPKQVKAKEK